MKASKEKILSLTVTIIMLTFAAVIVSSCTSKPIDESQLPDLSPQTEQAQQQPGESPADQPAEQPAEQATQQPSEQPAQQPAEQPAADQGQTSTVTEPLISEEQAMSIALNKVPGAAKADIFSFGREYDDGRWIYEGEIRYGGLEYDFEIDAQTGNILDWEIDD